MNMTGQLKSQLREAINGSGQPWTVTLDGQTLTIESNGLGLEFGFDGALNEDGDPISTAELQSAVDALQAVIDTHNAGL